MARIAVLTSGGVDSSLALARLVDGDRDAVTAFYLKIWLEDELAFLGSCPWREDLDYLRAVCDDLKVPLQVVSLQREYFDRVVSYTIRELKAGRTPSPDVVCNQSIKFAAFLERIDPDYTRVASGHYARTQVRRGTFHLLRGADPVKDQTYFLSQLSQIQLARCLFPIGHLRKAEVRDEARRRRLATSQRPDSQGICFLGRLPYDQFIEYHLGEHPGDIIDGASGRVLGEHRGYWYYTVGQRRGLGLSGGPWYVVAKQVEDNRIVVVHGDRLAEHLRDTLRIPEFHWIATPPIQDRLSVRVRHGEKTVPCVLTGLSDRTVELKLEDGDPGVAAGQFAVLYQGDECLGGGAIG